MGCLCIDADPAVLPAFEEPEQRSFNQRQAQLQTIKTHYTEHTASHSQEVGALTAKHAAEKADLIETKTQLSTSADDFRDRLHKSEREHAQLVALSADNEAKLEAKLKTAEATIEQERAESAKTTEKLDAECARLTAAHEKTSCALTHAVAAKARLTDQLKTSGEENQTLVRASDELRTRYAKVVKERDGYKTAYVKHKEKSEQRMLEDRRAEDEFDSYFQGLDNVDIDIEGSGAQPLDGRDGLAGGDGSAKVCEPAAARPDILVSSSSSLVRSSTDALLFPVSTTFPGLGACAYRGSYSREPALCRTCPGSSVVLARADTSICLFLFFSTGRLRSLKRLCACACAPACFLVFRSSGRPCFRCCCSCRLLVYLGHSHPDNLHRVSHLFESGHPWASVFCFLRANLAFVAAVSSAYRSGPVRSNDGDDPASLARFRLGCRFLVCASSCGIGRVVVFIVGLSHCV